MAVSSPTAAKAIVIKWVIMESFVKGVSHYLSLSEGLLLFGPQSIFSIKRDVSTI